jgi:alkylation response protein AidB-like acyl-CoA dehydrogenase
MNFEFSDDITTMREEVGRFLREQLPVGAVRRQIETGESHDLRVWRDIADMGWLGVAIPEEFGGAALGYEALCMIAEEMGKALPSVPFSSSIYLAAQAILEYGTQQQKQEYLPHLADGSMIGTFALAEGPGDPAPELVRARVASGKLSGRKLPVFDGAIAQFAVAAAQDVEGEIGLYIVHLDGPGVTRRPIESLDLGRAAVAIDFQAAPVAALPHATGWADVSRLLDRAAILFAFEQVGGAQAALAMALNYAMERFAFGRPIAALQAIKHKLADIYVATELARSNAYFGAWALDKNAPEIPGAAAAARLSATDAFYLAAKENIQIHGGMGFTWDSDCHLFYRRSKQLAGNLGSARYWRNRLIDQIVMQNNPEGVDGF